MLRANYSDIKLLGVHGNHGVVHAQVPESPGHLLGEAGHPAQAEQIHRPPEAVGVRGLVREEAHYETYFCQAPTHLSTRSQLNLTQLKPSQR